MASKADAGGEAPAAVTTIPVRADIAASTAIVRIVGAAKTSFASIGWIVIAVTETRGASDSTCAVVADRRRIRPAGADNAAPTAIIHVGKLVYANPIAGGKPSVASDSARAVVADRRCIGRAGADIAATTAIIWVV